MDDVKREAVLLQVIHLNDKSNLYFFLFLMIVSILGVIGTGLSAIFVGGHYLFLTAAFWILGRFVILEKGLEYNAEARRLLEELK